MHTDHHNLLNSPTSFSAITDNRQHTKLRVNKLPNTFTLHPTPEYIGKNLVPIPTGWSLAYGTGPQIITLDSTVTFNGNPSIRMAPHTSADMNTARECDSKWISCKPGDHVVFRAWVKNGAHSNTVYTGARIGIDFYCGNVPKGATGVVDGQPHGLYKVGDVWHSQGNATWVAGGWDYTNYRTFVDTPASDFLLPWGNDVWTLLEWDVIVPSKVYTQNYEAVPIAPQQICGMLAWMDVREVTDNANAWFANTELYINPTTT